MPESGLEKRVSTPETCVKKKEKLNFNMRTQYRTRDICVGSYLNDRCNLVNGNQMFCYQCEQTSKGKGCTTFGVCGKNPEVAALQDLLIYMLRGLSQLALEGQKVGVKDEQIDLFICESAFTTVTNVNFDPDTLIEYYQISKVP